MQAFHRLVLKTERLVLRPLVARDAPALFGIFSNPQVMRYWSSAAWDLEAVAADYIAKDARALRKGEHLRLGIETGTSAELIGMCTLYAFMRQCRRAEIGYALSRAYWGRGYMHEALSRLLDYGFENLELHRVETDVDPRNMASVRSLERLGFLKEGYMRERWIVDGEVSDTSFYGLLRSDWRARRANSGAAG